MVLSMKNFNIFGVHWKIWLLGGITKNKYIGWYPNAHYDYKILTHAHYDYTFLLKIATNLDHHKKRTLVVLW